MFKINVDYLINYLRMFADTCKKTNMKLPTEIVDIINGKQESNWKDINICKVLNYIADMLEK